MTTTTKSKWNLKIGSRIITKGTYGTKVMVVTKAGKFGINAVEEGKKDDGSFKFMGIEWLKINFGYGWNMA